MPKISHEFTVSEEEQSILDALGVRTNKNTARLLSDLLDNQLREGKKDLAETWWNGLTLAQQYAIYKEKSS